MDDLDEFVFEPVLRDGARFVHLECLYCGQQTKRAPRRFRFVVFQFWKCCGCGRRTMRESGAA